MKNIIVPIDFSIQSENALKVAAALAKKHGSKIYALHMLELNEAYITSTEGFHPEQTVFLMKMAEKKFTEFIDKPYLKNVVIKPVIKHFKVFSEVNEVAEAKMQILLLWDRMVLTVLWKSSLVLTPKK